MDPWAKFCALVESNGIAASAAVSVELDGDKAVALRRATEAVKEAATASKAIDKELCYISVGAFVL